MNLRGIRQRIEKLAAAAAEEAPIADQAEEVLLHWRETGVLAFPDGRRVPLEVFRHIVAPATPGESGVGQSWEKGEGSR